MRYFESEGITIDMRDPRFIRVRYLEWTQESYDAHWAVLMELLGSTSGPFVALVDILQAKNPSATQRRDGIQFWRDARPLMEGRLVAISYAVDSPILRGVLQLLSWFDGPPAPMRNFSSLEECEAWLRLRLEQHDARVGSE